MACGSAGAAADYQSHWRPRIAHRAPGNRAIDWFDFGHLQVTVEQARCYLDPQRVLLQRARTWFLRLCAAASAGTPACFAYDSRTDFALEDESAGSQIQIRLDGLPARIPAEVTPVAWFEIYCGEDKAKTSQAVRRFGRHRTPVVRRPHQPRYARSGTLGFS